MIEDSPIAIVAAAILPPFLSQVLAVSFGLWSRDRRLLRQGLLALFISTVLYWGTRGFDRKGPLSSFLISSVIGIAAGLSSADDAWQKISDRVSGGSTIGCFPSAIWRGRCPGFQAI